MENSHENLIRVRKNTGEYVGFDIDKLRNALARAGADESEIEAVVEQVRDSLYDGITTKKIYQVAYSILRKISNRSAGRYRLKKAMQELGPSGFPFENFVAKLLEWKGYEVMVDQVVEGACVKHEVDVVASKTGEQLMVECKYHSEGWGKCDVKVSLYIHSRFRDIEKAWDKDSRNRELRFAGMLVTNSRFTEDALQYGICAGLRLVSWDFPAGDSLKDWIDRSGFHPVTSLYSLTRQEKKQLLEKGVVLCRQISEDPSLLESVSLSGRRSAQVIKEVNALSA